MNLHATTHRAEESNIFVESSLNRFFTVRSFDRLSGSPSVRVRQLRADSDRIVVISRRLMDRRDGKTPCTMYSRLYGSKPDRGEQAREYNRRTTEPKDKRRVCTNDQLLILLLLLASIKLANVNCVSLTNSPVRIRFNFESTLYRETET